MGPSPPGGGGLVGTTHAHPSNSRANSRLACALLQPPAEHVACHVQKNILLEQHWLACYTGASSAIPLDHKRKANE
jgi:hypothetical protein